MASVAIGATVGIVLTLVVVFLWQRLAASRASAMAPPLATVGQGDIESRPAKGAPPVTRWALIGAGAIAVVAVGWSALRPSAPGSSALVAPITGSSIAAPGGKSLDDVDTMIGKLSARLKTHPEDGEGFRMLAWSYAMTGRPELAIDPYKRALALIPGQANVHEGYAEALAGIAGGSVTAEAKAELDRAHALDAADPRTRYFLGKWDAQNGKEQQALDGWIALANAGPADAPWQADVRRDIAASAARLKVDVTKRLTPGATPPAATAPVLSGQMAGGSAASVVPPLDAAQMQAGAALPPEQQQEMIAQMVDRLVQRVRDQPRDVAGWTMLMRSHMVLGQKLRAAGDLSSARLALAGDRDAIAQLNAAAKSLGILGNP